MLQLHCLSRSLPEPTYLYEDNGLVEAYAGHKANYEMDLVVSDERDSKVSSGGNGVTSEQLDKGDLT
jgi:hypothetical protein